MGGASRSRESRSCEQLRGKTKESNSQANGNGEEPLARGSVLRAAIDLLPEREVVVSAAVERAAERDSSHPVEHQV